MTAARRLLPLLAAWVGILVLFQLGVPGGRFLGTANLLDLSQQVALNAILAVGLTLVILVGGIDLSVGAVVALAGVVAVAALPRVGAVGGVLAGLAAGAAVGAGNGTLASRTRMPPFIVTLGTMMAARGAALRFNEGRPLPIPLAAEGFLALGNGRLGGWLPVPVVLMLAVFAAGSVLLHRTRFGQHLYAIGGNREAARFTGIRVARHEFAVYAACGALAGLAGVVHASQLYSAEPGSGQGFELDAIAAVVVGGTSFTGGIGTMPGTLLGAAIIGTLDKGLNQAGVHYSLQSVIKGAVILAAVWLDVRQRKGKE